MREHKSLICIGGPLAGKSVDARRGVGFAVALSDKFKPSVHDMKYQPNLAVEVERVEYRAEVFRTPQGDISFWVPQNQTALQTICLLLDTYEEHHK